MPAALTAIAACLLALVLGGGGPADVPAGLPDAGAGTGWTLRLLGVLAQLAGVLTVGSLLVRSVLVPARPGVANRGTGRAAARSAGAWCVLSVAVLVLGVAETVGVPLSAVRAHHVVPMLATAQGTGLLVVVLLTGTVAVAADHVRSRGGAGVLLLLAVAAVVPVALTGHPSSAADQEVATTGLLVHVVSATLWTGGLSGLLLHLRTAPHDLLVAVPRFSVLALVSYVALAGSGLLTASAHVDLSVRAWTSGYVGILVAKALLLVLLGELGHRHRRRTLPRLAEGRAGPFLRLAGAELLVMGAAAGLASALARTPTPAAQTGSPVTPAHGLGHATVPTDVDPFSVAELLGSWRPDALVLVVLGLALAAYLAGLRLIVRRGMSWPARRTGAFVGGLLLALLDLCSGVATYAPAMVSVQLGQLLVALLVVPALLAAGAPVSLWILTREARGRSGPPSVRLARGIEAASSPVVGAALVSVLLLGLYRTPLIELSLRSLWVHLLVLAAAVVSGLALWWPLLGVDPVPRPRSYGERAACVTAVVACLLLLAAQLGLGDRLLAGDWFLELRWGWVDPVDDQRRGGLVAALAALGTLGTALVLGTSDGAGGSGTTQPVSGQTLVTTRPSRS